MDRLGLQIWREGSPTNEMNEVESMSALAPEIAEATAFRGAEQWPI